jgi:NAD(P)-dependent dehydrogenase (short-subunit alcohol dehydrogenase family)
MTGQPTEQPLEQGPQNLRVIVTAAGAGIGRATAEMFADAGADVWICDLNEAALGDTCTRDRIHGTVADVSSTPSIDAFMTQAITALGGLDVLVNNAGVAGEGGRLEDLDPDAATATLDTNVTSMFRTSRHAIPVMRRQGSGLIVNISSTAGLLGFPYRAPYAASKWAVIGLTKTLAMELGEFGIRVNAICPGSIRGPRMDHVIDLEAAASGRAAGEIRRGFEEQVSMRRFIDAREIAGAIAYLASPAGRSVSGQALSVDGHTETLRT